MNLINAKLTLFFEIRVSNQGEIGEFCNILVEIANLYLGSISSPLLYTTADLTMEKREVSQVLLQRKASFPAEETVVPFTPRGSEKIEDCFSFLNRSIRCHLYRRHDIDTPLCEPTAVQRGEPMDEHFGEYPIRNLRVESLHRESIAAELQLEPEVAIATENERCCCGIWC